MTRGSIVFPLAGGVLLAAGGFACSGAKLPQGLPPPEYEDPPAPSWLRDGGNAAAQPSSGLPPGILDAPPPATPVPADAGTLPSS